MPECLDNMPWRSLKGLGDMAPDFLRLGDFKKRQIKRRYTGSVPYHWIQTRCYKKWSYPPTDLGDG